MPAALLLPVSVSPSAAPSLHKTPQWRDLSSVHLLCVMFFLPPTPPHFFPFLLSVTFTCSASSSLEPVHSDSTASSFGCCWGWKGKGRPGKHTETCLHSRQDRQGGGIVGVKERHAWRQKVGRGGGNYRGRKKGRDMIFKKKEKMKKGTESAHAVRVCGDIKHPLAIVFSLSSLTVKRLKVSFYPVNFAALSTGRQGIQMLTLLWLQNMGIMVEH